MYSLEALLIQLVTHPLLISLLAGILSEEYVFVLFLLAGAGELSLWQIVPFSILGILAHDFFFFILGRSSYSDNLFFYFKKRARKLQEWNVFQHQSFLALFLTKFVYGSRIIYILLLSRQRISRQRFFWFNLLAVVCWFAVMTPLGFFAGQGFVKLIGVAHLIEKIAVCIGVSVVVYFGIRYFVGKR